MLGVAYLPAPANSCESPGWQGTLLIEALIECVQACMNEALSIAEFLKIFGEICEARQMGVLVSCLIC